ncbi:hypothetical protein GCM10027591_08880 [Zhihengliuella somnathii]
MDTENTEPQGPADEPVAAESASQDAPNKVTNEYGASEITVLEGLEAVRKRPGMYIGSTGARGLHHLVYEVVDNSVDEALAGYCDHINVTLTADGGVRVSDNGRGIPVDMHPTEGKPTVEVVMTILHAGGKFGGGGYAVSGGLHGVGISVVNALSTRVVTEVRRQGHMWSMEFANGGVPQNELTQGEATDETGTTQTFYPDPEIFDTVDFDFETLRARFQQMAFLNKGLRITLTRRRRVRGAGRRAEAPRRRLPLQGRPARLRQAPQRLQEGGARPPGRHRLRVGGRGPQDLGRDRDAVDQRVLRVGPHLREHDQHARGRHARRGLPRRNDLVDQPLRPRQEPAQGEGRQPHG